MMYIPMQAFHHLQHDVKDVKEDLERVKKAQENLRAMVLQNQKK